jgi:hypothetical protein
MGFLAGRVTCVRFRVLGRSLRTFGSEQLEKLAGHAIGRQRVAMGDGAQAGWLGGDHILDTKFDLAKNVVNDAIHFAMRIDEQKVPSDLLRAYMQVELEALASQNPSGLPSGRQKRQARLMARERLENEAKDGRFLRRRSFPLLWDAPSGELFAGTTSATALDRLAKLFHQTFDRRLEQLGAGRQAFLLSEADDLARRVDDAQPVPFVAGQPAEIAWAPDESNRDFLGNEYLLWLWHHLENESDAIEVRDGSDVVVMISRTLQLECPRGQTGKESISSDGPAKLPEALRAIQAGKLPRKMGLTLTRQDASYELTLQAESLAIGSARLPAPEAEDERARLEERVTQLRHLMETLDLMYHAFLRRRLGDDWTREHARVKKWLSRKERVAVGESI